MSGTLPRRHAPSAAHAAGPARDAGLLSDVAVIVVAYNAAESLRGCLDSLAAHGVSTVIVVDNASTDAHVAPLAAHPAVTRWIRNEENLGYAGGHNIGVGAAMELGAAWVCLLNPDCVLEPGALQALRRAAQRSPRVGVVGPLIREGGLRQRIWSAGGRLDWRSGMAMSCHSGERLVYLRPREVDYVSGACFFVSCEAWRSVGPLDERYFLYFEDVDWCVRARAHGFAVRFEPAAVASHDWGASSRTRAGEISTTAFFYSARNRRRAFARAAELLGRREPGLTAWFGSLHYAATVLLFERDKVAKLRAIWDGVRAAARGEWGRRAA